MPAERVTQPCAYERDILAPAFNRPVVAGVRIGFPSAACGGPIAPAVKLVYGTTLKTLERKSGWVKVQREGGSRGWVARGLLWGW